MGLLGLPDRTLFDYQGLGLSITEELVWRSGGVGILGRVRARE